MCGTDHEVAVRTAHDRAAAEPAGVAAVRPEEGSHLGEAVERVARWSGARCRGRRLRPPGDDGRFRCPHPLRGPVRVGRRGRETGAARCTRGVRTRSGREGERESEKQGGEQQGEAAACSNRSAHDPGPPQGTAYGTVRDARRACHGPTPGRRMARGRAGIPAGGGPRGRRVGSGMPVTGQPAAAGGHPTLGASGQRSGRGQPCQPQYRVQSA